METHFDHSSTWNGIKALSGYITTNLLPSDDIKLSDDLNQFFACFDTQSKETVQRKSRWGIQLIMESMCYPDYRDAIFILLLQKLRFQYV